MKPSFCTTTNLLASILEERKQCFSVVAQPCIPYILVSAFVEFCWESFVILDGLGARCISDNYVNNNRREREGK